MQYRLRALLVSSLLLLAWWSLCAAPVHLESTFFYDGDISRYPWTPVTIAVDSDGTVAVAINRQIGAGNVPATNGSGSLVLLYDAAGEPIGQLHGNTSGMVDVAFGPDHRVYTAESWFGSGLHVYDRPGAAERFVPVRFLRGDGSHVDYGGPQSVAVGPDFRLWDYHSRDKKVHVLSPDDHNLLTIDPPANVGPRIKVAPDGTVYMSNWVLQADRTWTKFKYIVLDVRRDGKLLVQLPNGHLARYDRAADVLEAEYPLPADSWGDFALGPDNNVYLTPQAGRNDNHDAGLAYVVIAPGGQIVLTRGSDFDRLTVNLPDDLLLAGADTPITANTERSRVGYVPHASMLPGDNRAELVLKAWVAPLVADPLAPVTWMPVPCAALPVYEFRTSVNKPYALSLPATLFGRYLLRITAGRVVPGLEPLQVTREVNIRPAGATALLTPVTDRGRIGFRLGEAIRIPVVVETLAAVNLLGVRLALQSADGRTVWQAPLGLGALPAGSKATPVMVIPAAVSRVLAPARYQVRVIGLPPGVGSAFAYLELVSPVSASDFPTVLHPIGPGNQLVADARLHAELGASHVVLPADAPGASVPAYLDAATRLGLTAQYQPYSHFAALNSLPEEQGAMRQYYAATAQTFHAYPSFVGFNYHDLWAPFGTWWDNVRTEREKALWKQWAVPAPVEVPEAQRETYRTAVARALTLPQAYRAWSDAILRADPALMHSTMQWWHLDWTHADPDKVATDQDLIATQHMEEQFYHPVTIADQIEDWRQAGKRLYCYGNTDWQEDGTGGQAFRDIMTALSRGVQGAGRNELPGFGLLWTERVHRGAAPALKLCQVYGGISANSHPLDQVAVWRSAYAMSLEQGGRHPYRQHFWQTSAAFNACLYAHRTAAILTDGKVRQGGLLAYKAVIVSFEHPLPPALLKPLQDFQRAGGLVLANKPMDGYWCPPGALEIGQSFTESHACYDKNDDLDRWLDMQAGEGTVGAKVIRDALRGKVTPLVDTDDPATWLSVLQSGQTRYIMAVNMHLLSQPWEDLHRYAGYENTTLPARVTLRMPVIAGGVALYDVLNGKRLTPRIDRDGEWQLTADMSVFPGAIIAIVPQPVAGIKLAGGQDARHATLRVNAKVVAANGRLIDSAVPLTVAIDDARGQRYRLLHRTAVGGIYDEVLPLSTDLPAGRWTVTVQELFGGMTATASPTIQAPAPPAAVTPAPVVEWQRTADAVAALRVARVVALLVDPKQPALATAVQAAQRALAQPGRIVIQVPVDDYLADRKALGWDKFKPGDTYRPNLQLRGKKYDLLVSLETTGLLNGVIDPAILPVRPDAQDPGPGRGLVQYVVMPVYDTEDGLVLCGGDIAGLLAAVNSLAHPPPLAVLPETALPPLAALPAQSAPRPLTGLRAMLGIPISQVAGSGDGQRIAVTLKGWGNNLFVLDGEGHILNRTLAGKSFPLDLTAEQHGFWVTTYENDPTVAYRLHLDREGQTTLRLAANGRRLGGARDWSANHPIVQERFEPQASFSITPDGRFAAVGGSRGIAVWDLPAQRLLWRDDTVCHTVPLSQKADVAPDASMFPQVRLTADGAVLMLQHHNRIELRDGGTGRALGEQRLPEGVSLGRARLFDGHVLVVGDTDFFAFRDGQPYWHWKAPKEVTATAFAADGLHYAVGEPDGTVRLLSGGGQIGGFVAACGGIDSLAISPDGARLAFSTSAGQAGVLDADGQVIWQAQVSNTRTQIAFLNTAGETVVGDWRGYVSRHDAAGKMLWSTDLTPQVYRDDLATALTTPDATPALRVPAPVQVAEKPLDAALKVLPQTISYVPAAGWHGPVDALWPGGMLMDGNIGPLAKAWFSRNGAYWLAGAPAAPAFDLQFRDPVTLSALVVNEDPTHPEAVPQEIAIDAWVNENWVRLVHDQWVTGNTHAHRFAPTTTTKLRYTVLGDLYHNLWTTELTAYRAP